MTSLISHVLAWPTFLLALLVFGFAPGTALRIIVLVYKREDPRRQELLSELYHVSRIERPFWVAEQLELALVEGLRDRFVGWRIRRLAFVPSPISREEAEAAVFVIATLRRAGVTPDEIRHGFLFPSPNSGRTDSEQLTSGLARLSRYDLFDVIVVVALLQRVGMSPEQIWDALWPRSKWCQRTRIGGVQGRKRPPVSRSERA